LSPLLDVLRLQKPAVIVLSPFRKSQQQKEDQRMMGGIGMV
jgi:hypothetical protein